MADQSVKRIVEVFYETEIKAKEISAEIKAASEHAKALTKHLTEDAVVLLVWDLLPTSKRPGKERVRQVLRALMQLDQYIQKPEP